MGEAAGLIGLAGLGSAVGGVAQSAHGPAPSPLSGATGGGLGGAGGAPTAVRFSELLGEGTPSSVPPPLAMGPLAQPGHDNDMTLRMLLQMLQGA
jgi:hypothetical protein